MSGSLIANRYARALLKVSGGQASLSDRFMTFLDLAQQLFEDPSIRRVLKSPVVPSDVKSAVLDYVNKAVGGGKEEENFIQQLLVSGRVELLPDIRRSFKEMLDHQRGVSHARIVTVDKLSQADESSLKAALSKTFKNKLELENIIDPSILGGLVVEVGNSAIDLSLKTKLEVAAAHALQ